MYTVKDIFGHKNKRGHVGIEVEVEADNPLPSISEKPWISKPETSLRGFGMEYITSSPILCDSDKTEALDKLSKILYDKAYKVNHDSPRTSVHVHVNVLGLTPVQVYTAACAYWLIENPLMEWCGPTRVGNKFCLRLKDAEGILGYMKHEIKGDTKLPFSYYHANTCKYGGLNLNAVSRFGSLEFRGLRGVYDTKTMDLWSTSMYTLVTRAAELFESPSALMDYYYKNGPYRLISKLLEAELLGKLPYNKLPDAIEENAERLCNIAYGCSWKDWSETVDKCVERHLKTKSTLSYDGDATLTVSNSLNQVFAQFSSGSVDGTPVTIAPKPAWQSSLANSYQIFDHAKVRSATLENSHGLMYKIYHLPFNSAVYIAAKEKADSFYVREAHKQWLDKFCRHYRSEYRALVGSV